MPCSHLPRCMPELPVDIYALAHIGMPQSWQLAWCNQHTPFMPSGTTILEIYVIYVFKCVCASMRMPLLIYCTLLYAHMKLSNVILVFHAFPHIGSFITFKHLTIEYLYLISTKSLHFQILSSYLQEKTTERIAFCKMWKPRNYHSIEI